MDNNLIFLNACRNGQKNIVQIFLKKGGIDLSLNKWVELVTLINGMRKATPRSIMLA